MNQQKESQIIQNMIDQSHKDIAHAEAEILRLFRPIMSRDKRIDKRGIALAIQDLQYQIASLNQGIASLEHRLPTVIAMEQVVDTINTNNARAQAEREAQAAAERNAHMREAAQQRYLSSGGDPLQFEAAWPAIRQQIATEQATQAATVALAVPTGVDQARSAVETLLAARYGHNQQGG